MELDGALSNPIASDKRLRMARLAAAKSDISIREPAPDQVQRRLPRRQGPVLATVTGVLGLASTPMRVSEIHTAVEQLLGEPISYSSVKEALSAHTRGRDQRFRRTRRGCCELLWTSAPVRFGSDTAPTDPGGLRRVRSQRPLRPRARARGPVPPLSPQRAAALDRPQPNRLAAAAIGCVCRLGTSFTRPDSYDAPCRFRR